MRTRLALILAAAGIVTGCATAPQTADSQKTPGLAGVYGPATQANTLAYDPHDLLGRIRSGFRLGELDSPLVHVHEQWYARRPAYVKRMMERSSRYLYYIVGEVEKRNMPTEIALLPMIESAYNPVAYSHSNASGIWQFVPATGRDFGLKQNHWVDNRRDIRAATHAALTYLTRLHAEFGDWDLAIAAYNCGEGLVSRTIARQKARGLPTDYLHLPLPEETRNYVPKLLAVKHIIQNPSAFGLNIDQIPNSVYFREVQVKKHLPIRDAARLAGMTVPDFMAMNPAFKKQVIPDYASNLLLPVKNADLFEQGMTSYNNPLANWQYYHAHRGERIADIAQRSGVSITYLAEINHLPHTARLAENQTLLTPPRVLAPALGTTMLALGPTPATAPPPVALPEAQPARLEAPAMALAAADRLPVRVEAHKAHGAAAARLAERRAERLAERDADRADEPRSAPAHVAGRPAHAPAHHTLLADNDSEAVRQPEAHQEIGKPHVRHAALRPTLMASLDARLTPAAVMRAAQQESLPAPAGHVTRIAMAPAYVKEAPGTTRHAVAHDESNSTRSVLARADSESIIPHFYHVQFGDTVYNIAKRLAVTPEEVKLWNNLHSNQIHLGQRLALKGGHVGGLMTASATGSTTDKLAALNAHMRRAAPSVMNYTVRLGDTLHSIARQFNVQVADLMRWNTHHTLLALHPGDKVKVRLAQE